MNKNITAPDLWPDVQPETYSEANQVGRDRAGELVERMRRTDSPALLGITVEAIIAKGKIGGVEIGFFHALSIELMQAQVTQFVEVPADRNHGGRKMGHLQLVRQVG
jgi:hypothetical protein